MTRAESIDLAKPSVIEKPMIFTGESVRAILAGRMTQTRRICPFPLGREAEQGCEWKPCLCAEIDPSDKPCVICETRFGCAEHPIGSRIWARETWVQSQHLGDIFYKATHGSEIQIPWKSARFMPRKFSRLLLEVTDVRVQRVQEISEEDAKADGIEPFGPDDGRWVFAYTFKLLSNPGRPDAGLPRGS